MAEFNSQEKEIIRVLYSAQKPLTTKKISEVSEISWQTAKKYLSILHDKDVVVGATYSNSIYWCLK